MVFNNTHDSKLNNFRHRRDIKYEDNIRKIEKRGWRTKYT